MNLIEFPIENGVIKGLNVKAPNEVADLDRVIVGIRPDEAIAVVGHNVEGIALAKAIVYSITYEGSRLYLTVDIEGRRLRVQGLFGYTYREGEEVTVAVKKLHIFHPETKTRITTLEASS